MANTEGATHPSDHPLSGSLGTGSVINLGAASYVGTIVRDAQTDTARPGDVVSGSWRLADGLVDVASDVAAALDKFANALSSPAKALLDLEPAVPDRKINITNVVAIRDAFVSDLYPLDPPIVPCR